MRGAIAYALAVRNTSTIQRQYIYTATSLLVIVTVLINGGFTQYIIDKLGIKYGDSVPSEATVGDTLVCVCVYSMI
jgi:sodium/hydrogen exchanger-like protein 6/7